MATRTEVEVEFIRYHTAPDERAKPDRKVVSKMAAGDWRYEEDTLYYQNWPYRRCVEGTNRRRVILQQAWRNDDTIHQFTGSLRSLKHITVPTIGVHSRFPGDRLDAKELHERMRYLFAMEASFLTEDFVDPVSGGYLARKGRQLLDIRIQMMCRRWNSWREMFGVKWFDMPTTGTDRALLALDTKIRNYKTPAAEAKREKDKAVRVAKKAFGL